MQSKPRLVGDCLSKRQPNPVFYGISHAKQTFRRQISERTRDDAVPANEFLRYNMMEIPVRRDAEISLKVTIVCISERLYRPIECVVSIGRDTTQRILD